MLFRSPVRGKSCCNTDCAKRPCSGLVLSTSVIARANRARSPLAMPATYASTEMRWAGVETTVMACVFRPVWVKSSNHGQEILGLQAGISPLLAVMQQTLAADIAREDVGS